MRSRHPLQITIVFLTLVAIARVSLLAGPLPDEAKIGGFALGAQAYTFNRFTVFEAIEKTAEAGGKTIEFFPSQKLSAAEPDVKWGHDVSDEVIKKVKDKLAKHHIVAVNYGVVGGRDE